jgi:two-component system, chemotaxis family, protein-glutamate methylesterase/glutaminase
MSDEYRLDRPTALTCPECGGAMQREESGTLLQFRCHIGHVLNAETMLAAQFAVLEARLAASLISLKERAELCRQMVEAKQGRDLAELELAEREAHERAKAIKSMLETEWRYALRAEPDE